MHFVDRLLERLIAFSDALDVRLASLESILEQSLKSEL
jgi:hypothetical protein